MRVTVAGRAFLTLLLLLASQLVQAGVAFDLINNAEYARDKEFAARAPADQDGISKGFSFPEPGAPVIELQTPKLQDTLKAPFAIHLVFKAAEDAEVVPDSFKVLYGFLKLDITERITQHAKPTKDGLSVEQANIPAGSHKLLLQIRDSKNRQAEKTMSFNVE